MIEETEPLPLENLLSGESSPYLRQHQDNPVHWRGWNQAALTEARRLDRPILLSIGYAACHWCHVMAHESFESQDIAAVMNELFVNIKVDREERPEIDQLYMAALTAMGEQGGWPLTMFLTPDAKPFWGGTYFPPTGRYGRPGFLEVMRAIDDAWRTRREAVVQNALVVSDHVAKRLAVSEQAQNVTRESLSGLANAIHGMIDQEKGGLRGAPKFPNAPMMQTLWLNWRESGNSAQREDVVKSYSSMLHGGIYDHVGGGLARYATDTDWNVPHFEKMLYDNGQLLHGLVHAYAETQDSLFRMRIEETANWLLTDLRSPGGAFQSSYDADSDGEEGLFYTWSEGEIQEVLRADTSALMETHELVSPPGWEGKPILRLRQGALPVDRTLLEQLRHHRGLRVWPGLDAKVLTDWNGITIAALALAGRSLGNQTWIDAAEAAFAHIFANRDAAGRLPHSMLEDRRLYPALSSDYAAMILAALELHSATRMPVFIEQGKHLSEMLESWHSDGVGGHFLSASDASDVPIRIRGDIDEAIPSATSMIIEALAKLALATGDPVLQDRAWIASEHAMGRIREQAYGQAGVINACAIARQAMKLVIADEPGGELVPVANRFPDPRRVDIFVPAGEIPDAVMPSAPASALPVAYLCSGQTCLAPIHTAAELETALHGTG